MASSFTSATLCVRERELVVASFNVTEELATRETHSCAQLCCVSVAPLLQAKALRHFVGSLEVDIVGTQMLCLIRVVSIPLNFFMQEVHSQLALSLFFRAFLHMGPAISANGCSSCVTSAAAILIFEMK